MVLLVSCQTHSGCTAAACKYAVITIILLGFSLLYYTSVATFIDSKSPQTSLVFTTAASSLTRYRLLLFSVGSTAFFTAQLCCCCCWHLRAFSAIKPEKLRDYTLPSLFFFFVQKYSCSQNRSRLKDNRWMTVKNTLVLSWSHIRFKKSCWPQVGLGGLIWGL